MAINIEFLKQVKIPYNVFRPINTTNSSIDINPNARVALLMQSNTGNQLGEPEGWGSFYDIIKLALDAINTPQTLSILGQNLTISGGNTIALPSSATLYNANSTLTSNRIVTMGNFSLSFTGSSTEQFNVSGMVSASMQASTVTLTTGLGAGFQISNHANILLDPTSELRLNGSGGTVGQAIISQGAGAVPVWEKVARIKTIATAINHAAQDGEIIFCTVGVSGITVTLPSAAGKDGMQVTVKQIDAGGGNLGVVSAGGNIEGVALPYLGAGAPGGGTQFTSHGGNWWVTGTF